MKRNYTAESGNSRKGVIQYSLDGKFLKEYISIAEAARVSNSHSSKIQQVCSGQRKTTNNYIWEYKETTV